MIYRQPLRHVSTTRCLKCTNFPTEIHLKVLSTECRPLDPSFNVLNLCWELAVNRNTRIDFLRNRSTCIIPKWIYLHKLMFHFSHCWLQDFPTFSGDVAPSVRMCDLTLYTALPGLTVCRVMPDDTPNKTYNWTVPPTSTVDIYHSSNQYHHQSSTLWLNWYKMSMTLSTSNCNSHKIEKRWSLRKMTAIKEIGDDLTTPNLTFEQRTWYSYFPLDWTTREFLFT